MISFESKKEPELSNELASARQDILMDTIRKKFGFLPDNNEKLAEWINEYSSEYNKVFEDVLQEKGEKKLLNEYQSGPESMIDEISGRLKTEHDARH